MWENARTIEEEFLSLKKSMIIILHLCPLLLGYFCWTYKRNVLWKSAKFRCIKSVISFTLISAIEKIIKPIACAMLVLEFEQKTGALAWNKRELYGLWYLPLPLMQTVSKINSFLELILMQVGIPNNKKWNTTHKYLSF